MRGWDPWPVGLLLMGVTSVLILKPAGSTVPPASDLNGKPFMTLSPTEVNAGGTSLSAERGSVQHLDSTKGIGEVVAIPTAVDGYLMKRRGGFMWSPRTSDSISQQIQAKKDEFDERPTLLIPLLLAKLIVPRINVIMTATYTLFDEFSLAPHPPNHDSSSGGDAGTNLSEATEVNPAPHISRLIITLRPHQNSAAGSDLDTELRNAPRTPSNSQLSLLDRLVTASAPINTHSSVECDLGTDLNVLPQLSVIPSDNPNLCRERLSASATHLQPSQYTGILTDDPPRTHRRFYRQIYTAPARDVNGPKEVHITSKRKHRKIHAGLLGLKAHIGFQSEKTLTQKRTRDGYSSQSEAGVSSPPEGQPPFVPPQDYNQQEAVTDSPSSGDSQPYFSPNEASPGKEICGGLSVGGVWSPIDCSGIVMLS